MGEIHHGYGAPLPPMGDSVTIYAPLIACDMFANAILVCILMKLSHSPALPVPGLCI